MQWVQLSFHFRDVETDTKIDQGTDPMSRTLKAADLRWETGPHI